VSVLLQFVGEAGHGGALFVLPEDAVPDALAVKYCIEPASTMLRTAALRMQNAEDAKDWAIADVADATTMQLAGAATSMAEAQRHEWLNAAECVARLAGVDGAMLLTRDLRLRGLGAVVRLLSERESPLIVRALDAGALERLPYDVSGSGTRHRSATVFCEQNPRAAAFVVSQDGEMSAMRAIDGTVTVWRIKP